ncbi:hypothetical protein DFH09DRAFT_1067424 [Mycena vulgaris]|nr:hypothetical protein DFH09DRAFT_1067424 [Mycena vulgaris]
MHNQICFCYFYKNGVPPEHLRLQDITTLPQVNLSQHPKLLKKMDLSPDNKVYFMEFPSRIWSHDNVDTTLMVIPNQTLLIWRMGVDVCEGVDDMIVMYAPKRKSGKSRLSKRKPDHEHDASNHVVQITRTTQKEIHKHLPAASSLSLPCRASSPINYSSLSLLSPSSSPIDLSLSPDSSSLFLLPQCCCPSLIVESLVLPRRSRLSSPEFMVKPEPQVPDVDLDDLWQLGSVFIVPGFRTWPACVYTHDMAVAFKWISAPQKKEDGKDSLAEQRDDKLGQCFTTVFPSVKFMQSTYYRQFNFWQNSTQKERDASEKMPREGAGLWTKWRKTTPGYARFKDKQGQ